MQMPDTTILLALYRGLPDPVIVVDAGLRIVSINPAAEAMLGYDPSDLVGSPLAKVMVDAAGDRPTDGDIRPIYRRKDGAVIDACATIIPIPGADGGAATTVHILRQAAVRDQVPDAAGEHWRAALDAISEGIAIFDAQERLLLVNSAFRHLYGSRAANLRLGMTLTEMVEEAANASDVTPAQPGSSEARAWVEELFDVIRRADGRSKILRYANGRWMRVQNRRADNGHSVVIRVDVTELKTIELALERQRLDYATLVENLPDFLTRASSDLRYTFVNGRFADFVGVPSGRLVGQALLSYVPEQERAIVKDALLALTPDAPLITREQHRRRGDGTDLWILWSNIAVFVEGQVIEYVSVGRDITEVKAQQVRIAEQSAELERKNAALGEFTGTVSHDLKAPMRHISMFSQMIAEDIAAGVMDDLPVYSQHLQQSSRRMLQMIDSLLDYARIADRITQYDGIRLRDIVDDALLNLRSDVVDSGATISLGDVPDVAGDGELLKRLFQNVLGNAIKYRRPAVAPSIAIDGARSGSTVRVTIADNGIGIDPRHARTIFEVFQRLHQDEATYPGTGVGLALAKRITESHGGSIELDPTYIGGARFVITLPAFEPS